METTNPSPAPGFLSVVEMILKDRERLDEVLSDPASPSRLASLLLRISLTGFTIFGIVAGSILGLAQAVVPGYEGTLYECHPNTRLTYR